MFGKKDKEPTYIDSREVKHSKSKLWLWILWLLILLISIAYCVLSFISFRKLVKVAQFENNGIQSDVLWAVLAASFIGPFTVAAFFAFGTVVLLKKTVSESGLTYSYGALHWSALWMAVVVLQSGVALNGQKTLMKDSWEKKRGVAQDLPWAGGDTALVIATYVFAYILAIFYVILFFIMLALRKALTKLMLPDGHPSRFTGSAPGAVKRSSSSSSSRSSAKATAAAGASSSHEAAPPEPATTEPIEGKTGGAWDVPATEPEESGKHHKHHRFHRHGDKHGKGKPAEPVAEV